MKSPTGQPHRAAPPPYTPAPHEALIDLPPELLERHLAATGVSALGYRLVDEFRVSSGSELSITRQYRVDKPYQQVWDEVSASLRAGGCQRASPRCTAPATAPEWP